LRIDVDPCASATGSPARVRICTASGMQYPPSEVEPGVCLVHLGGDHSAKPVFTDRPRASPCLQTEPQIGNILTATEGQGRSALCPTSGPQTANPIRSALRPSSPLPLLGAALETGRSFRKRLPLPETPSCPCSYPSNALLRERSRALTLGVIAELPSSWAYIGSWTPIDTRT